MAFTFDSTNGGTTTNSYVTVAEADDYNESFLFSDDWDLQSSTRKEKLLVMAFRSIEAKQFFGKKTTSTQFAKFPRYSLTDWEGNSIPSNIIPQQLKDAQCELANYLLENEQRYIGDGSESSSTDSYSANGVSVTFKDTTSADNLPAKVTELLKQIGPMCFKHSKRNHTIKL